MRTVGGWSLALVLTVGCAPPGWEDGHSVERVDQTPAVITFAADWTQHVTGSLVAGAPVQIVYDPARLPQCRGTTNNSPAWAIGGYFRVNGGNPQTFGVAPTSGTTPSPVTITLPETPGTVEFWFDNGNVYGCHAWDSNYGRNYGFTVGTDPRAPGWVGNGAYILSRGTCSGGPCDADRHPITDTWQYETWARQRAAIRALYFDVWKSGVTDHDNPDLWRQLDVRMYYRFGGSAPFTMQYVSFDTRVGNNARYAVDLRGLDPLSDTPAPTTCPPVPLAPSPDGMLVSTQLQYYFTVNGTEYRPASGATFLGVYSNYRTPLMASCLPH